MSDDFNRKPTQQEELLRFYTMKPKQKVPITDQFKDFNLTQKQSLYVDMK